MKLTKKELPLRDILFRILKAWYDLLYNVLFWPLIFILMPILIIITIIQDIYDMTVEYPE